ncbi:hypothetical protein UlMin_038576 [Ulmus minor]
MVRVRPSGEKESTGETKPAQKAVVVAVEKNDKASQRALKWVVDRLLSRDKIVTLVHVKKSSDLVEMYPDKQAMKALRPYKFFCLRRQIRYELVLLEDFDVAQALIGFVLRHRAENLVLGGSSNHGFSCIFNHGSRNIPRTVLKWTPTFCNVFVVSKFGKLRAVRNAARPVPVIAPPAICVNREESENEIDFSLFPETPASVDGSTAFNSLAESDSVDDFEFVDDFSAEDVEEASMLLVRQLEFMEQEMRRVKIEGKGNKDL